MSLYHRVRRLELTRTEQRMADRAEQMHEARRRRQQMTPAQQAAQQVQQLALCLEALTAPDELTGTPAWAVQCMQRSRAKRHLSTLKEC